MALTEKQAGIQDRISEIRKMRLGDIADNSRNWRLHPERQRKALSEAYKKVGWAGMPLVYFSEREGKLTFIDGHLRKEETPDLTVRVAVTDLNDAEADILLSTYDPLGRLAEVNVDALAELEKSIDIDLGDFWPVGELETLLKGLNGNDEVEETEPQIDKAEELQKEYETALGQIWRLGEHRLAVGDCTDKGVVEAVLHGEKPLLMVTDPPYGVKYDPNWRNEAAEKGFLSYAKRRIGIVHNDDRIDWADAYLLFPGDVAYTWSPPGDHVILTGMALQSAGFQIRNQIMWSKPHFPISRGHYTYQHEPCWYGVRKGKKSHWIGDHKASTVWPIPLDKNVDGGHSTQKPLECMSRPVANHQGDVYDPFLGSGTTMVACENLGRRCFACEIDPGYAAVSIHRWESHTGQKAELIEG